MKRLFLALVFLSGCAVTNSFKVGLLDCNHIVSTQVLGTAQVVECEQDGQVKYINSFSGIAGIEPVEKALEAGIAIGVFKNLPALRTNNTVKLCNVPGLGTAPC